MEYTEITERTIKHVLAEFDASVKQAHGKLYVKTPDGTINESLRAFIRAHKHRIMVWADEMKPSTKHQAPNK